MPDLLDWWNRSFDRCDRCRIRKLSIATATSGGSRCAFPQLVFVYANNEAVTLTPEQKRQLQNVVAAIKRIG